MCNLITLMDKSNGYLYYSEVFYKFQSAKEKFKDLRMQLFQSEEANISELIMDIEEDQYDDIDDRMHDELFN